MLFTLESAVAKMYILIVDIGVYLPHIILYTKLM